MSVFNNINQKRPLQERSKMYANFDAVQKNPTCTECNLAFFQLITIHSHAFCL
jgi:hypothetical protein